MGVEINAMADSSGSMTAAAVISISGAGKAPWKFKKPSLYDGLNPEREAFEWIDARCKPEEYGRLWWSGRLAGLPASELNEWKKLRGLTNFPKIVVNGKLVDPSAINKNSLVGWAVMRFDFDHAQALGASLDHKEQGGKFKFYGGDDYASDFADAPELVEDVFPGRGIAMIYGESGGGKTFWTLDMAFHVHNGQQWRDNDVMKGDVFYIAAEAGRGIKKRIEGIRRGHPDWRAPYVADLAPDLSKPGSVVSIIEAIRSIPDVKPAMVVIDTMSAAFEGDDSSQRDAATAMRNLKTLADGLVCLVVFVHHTTKTKDSWRGSGVWYNDVDAVVEVTADGPEGQRIHCATQTKHREGENGARYPFRLRKTDPLATKSNGKFITTCTVEHLASDGVPGTVFKNMSGTLKVLQPVFSELSLEGPVTLGKLLAEAKKKGIAVKKYNVQRDYAKHFNRSIPEDSDEMWFS
ncbi:AAA family ATPase [Paraburkholderia gardini]|uniref:AAA family ATPase n=1 Tax=Paraburkholderia gardini TaxID=2823469 RepID=UPI001DD63817|nr:AAA family ATPase [Paraburkholderia gardini]CAG4924732.1 hypothetical protein R69919_05235 [Paraburkholderia gardini]